VRVSPRPPLARYRQFFLEVRVVGPQILVTQRPVRAYPVAGVGGEVAGVETRGVAGVVDHRAAHSAAGVVGAKRDRIVASNDPRIGPVQVMRARLIADPVGIRVPERARIQANHPPARPRQPLQHRGPACAAANNDQVHFIGIGEPAHVRAQPVVGTAAIVRQQPCRLVAVAHLAHRPSPPRTGSSDGFTSRTSNGSRASMPAFLYPRG
jgi:hypothetical protein